jgi:putative flippase GtrA
VGIATSYLGNHRWVFRRTGRHGVHVTRFGGVYVAVLGVHWAIMSATVDVLHWHYAAGFLMPTALATALTFMGNRTLVLR